MTTQIIKTSETNYEKKHSSEEITTPALTSLDDRITILENAIQKFTSSISGGGSTSETLVVTGLLSTDIILAVSQKTEGANSVAIIAWLNQLDDSLDIKWTGDPGNGAIIEVLIQR